MKHNEHQLDAVPEFVRDIGADDYRIELFTSRTAQTCQKNSCPLCTGYQKYDMESNLTKDNWYHYMKQLTTPCATLWNVYKHLLERGC